MNETVRRAPAMPFRMNARSAAALGVSLAALAVATPALAQQATTAAPAGTAAAVVATDQYIELDPITVIATRIQQTWIDTLAAVSVRRPDDIQQLMPTTTADLFRGMPGVTAIENPNSTQTAINIRGLQDFGRVAVIVDGARQNFTQLGHGNGAGTFFVEPGLISTVDVVRGPVSNIYGSGAIGGVVMLQTKDANDIIAPGKTWGIEANAEGGSNGPMGFGSLFGATRIGQNVDLFVGGTYRSQDDFKDGNGDTVPNSAHDDWTGIAKVTVRPADFHEVKLSFMNYDSSYTTASEATATSTQYSTDVQNTTASVAWNYSNPDDNLFDWRSSVYWNRVDQDQVKTFGSSNAITGKVGDPRNFQIDTVGFDANNTSRFTTGSWAHAVTYGGDYFHDDVDNTDNYGFGAGYNPSGERGVGGAFVQLKSNYSTWLETIAALRYDAYSLSSDNSSGTSGDRFSPKFTVGVTPWDWLTVYATYAEGYRAPSVTEALVSGAHPAFFTGGLTPFSFVPNPNLKPEVGKNKEIGVNIKKDGLFVAGDKLRIKANYYQNDVDDYIELMTFGDPACIYSMRGRCYAYNSYSLAQYQNVDEARLRGFEFEGSYDARTWFLGLAGQTTDGKVTAGENVGQPLSTIPPDQISTTLGFRFLDEKLTIAARWTAVAAMKASDLPDSSVYDPTPSFNIVSLYAGYQFNESTLLRFSVENLLDEQYTQYQNFLPSAGLTVKAGLTVRFGGGEVASAAPLITK
ncbi:TonB-dependent hemoglobin/transferrin/lactoferrin family receptor [Ancylobacter sp. 6x-1]|uniref:TonB-dependent hemoglobin/transferrin/lactoferrin family receptor n=1 Tax=Ancylobacter crimeensis TaxID=2579147 RepID=A0ABT0D622_9HYPH|nr:TonB-dependent hemoglobin/transferrin/lactoferrin family receptor [Ancylobacter crimeensis]MCK0195395.1 TonB-dependent hemoglobin/transferrin/lactoferrin family receptor [Ancylobacter crimeensis]